MKWNKLPMGIGIVVLYAQNDVGSLFVDAEMQD